MAEKEDIYNQTTEALADNSDSRLADFDERLQVLENRIGRTTRELRDGASVQNISKELEEIQRGIHELKLDRVPESLSIDLKRRCIYCGNGVYRKVCNGRNLMKSDATRKTREWGVEYDSGNSFTDWIILVCNRCGNVQYFAQPDPDLWEK